MKIYTRAGDTGLTKLYINNEKLETLSKAESIFDALGKIDELNVEVALLRNDVPFCANLGMILINISGDIQAGFDDSKSVNINDLIDSMEEDIDDMTSTLPPLRNFIIPMPSSYSAHKCRVITREVERLLVKQRVSNNYIKFFNRLSDYFFTLARVMSQEEIIVPSKEESAH